MKVYTSLLLVAYLPNPCNYEQVNHKDEDKSHNYLNNLEWCDRAYNMNYGTQIKRASEKKQIKVECIETGQVFNSMKEACEALGLGRVALTNYFNRGYKTCGGYTWRKL